MDGVWPIRPKHALVAVASFVGWTIVFMIGCVFVLLWMDVRSGRFVSDALPYVVYFVAGIFCAIAIASSAGEFMRSRSGESFWMDDPDAHQIATRIALIDGGLTLLWALLYLVTSFGWNVANPEVFVPDSAPHSLTFLVAMLGGFALIWHVTVRDPLPPTGLAAKTEPRRRRRRKKTED